MAETVIAGRYRLDEQLGRGGMSEVWLAEDLELGRRVAIKLLAPEADTARFEREARAVASLAHPNITQLYDYGEADGRPYMVLEYVPGGTLEDRLGDRKPLADGETHAIAVGIAAGLAHAHARGLVHRDLKPANVLFDDEGRPKVADFGIARMATGEGTLTEAGTVLGTAAYISPEQAAGEPATPASDVYSFGVILYRMLTGRLPFESSDPMALAVQHRDEPPPPLTQFRTDAPAALESTATAALSKDPIRRPADGAALLGALGISAGAAPTAATTILAGDAVTRVLPVAPPPAAPADVFAEPAPPRRRWPLIAAALVLLALGGGALAYAVTHTGSPPEPVETLPPLTEPSTTKPTTSAPATTEATTATTQPTTTEATTTEPTTTEPATTAATTQPTTTAATATTATEPTTTAAPPTTTAPTTTEAPPTTAPPATTDTAPTAPTSPG